MAGRQTALTAPATPAAGIRERSLWRRVTALCATVSDRRLFIFTAAWVVAAGLLLQLVLLPYVFPFAHWGHGLIYSMDSMSFHLLAVEQAQRIREAGWSAWQLRPGGQFPAGLASIFYVLVYAKPWVVLPVNAILFALTVVAVRRMFSVMFGSALIGLAAAAPFFLYLSFVPIWGQLHKDVVSGAGVVLILGALVAANAGRGPTVPRLLPLAAMAVAGAALVWLVRPYAIFLAAAGAVAYAALAVFGRAARRGAVVAVVAVIVVAAVVSVEPWKDRPSVAWDIPAEPPVTAEAPTGDPVLPTYPACAPAPMGGLADRVLFFVCVTREGFKLSGEEAGSNVDYGVRMRFVTDYVAYVPRVLRLIFLEPVPVRWGTERSYVGRLGSVFVPLEMLLAYASFVLVLLFAARRALQFDVLAIVAYCCAYTAFIAYTVPNLGTLYRMRAFPFSLIVSTAIAVFLSRIIPPDARSEEGLADA